MCHSFQNYSLHWRKQGSLASLISRRGMQFKSPDWPCSTPSLQFDGYQQSSGWDVKLTTHPHLVPRLRIHFHGLHRTSHLFLLYYLTHSNNIRHLIVSYTELPQPSSVTILILEMGNSVQQLLFYFLMHIFGVFEHSRQPCCNLFHFIWKSRHLPS